MLIKILLIGLLLVIIVNLFKALPIMLKGQSSRPMSHYLGWRIGLSVVVFSLIVIALLTGVITPNPRPY
ncbi:MULTISPECIES: DUF2909 domain-containing protein [Photobacterium]|uniref:DUF2909 domain-containing protein n=1 Tax=Photobacterium angustum TaxID=661 RepID=A0A2S7W292_PHOAN|nr:MULTISPECIES: DUF2909 domain-containing protein [Photobacterium]PQJ68178.1 hypothetical protein BTO08_12750 [Photobacterium angustum]PSV30400.1 DUF2909 domain-containing protein [Photobacterium sp. GB-72]PSV33575.1 DUF2909 domain-containing protein [Photobacterium sp. GB-210]PSV44324.1 DUF2909 domain-containing protein [Photobacterium sp. GB-36]PSV52790.1 DUF2909 domain-containing protein [Photobacterium sp. GB-1]